MKVYDALLFRIYSVKLLLALSVMSDMFVTLLL